MFTQELLLGMFFFSWYIWEFLGGRSWSPGPGSPYLFLSSSLLFFSLLPICIKEKN